MSLLTIGIPSVIVAGILSAILFRRARRVQWIVLFLAAAFFAYAAVRLYGNWNASFVITLGPFTVTYTNTWIGWLFLAFSSGVSVVISIFSLSFNDRKHVSGIGPLWTVLLAANAGIFLASDWIGFLVAWELMGWTSYFIISHGKEKSFQAGIYYFTLSLVGTATLLAAVFLIQSVSGTLDIAGSITALRARWATNPAVVYVVASLLTITFFAKSAAGPFYMWPAMAHAEAPDDFSSFLSGIMIKYGVYGLILAVVPLFAGTGGTAGAGGAVGAGSAGGSAAMSITAAGAGYVGPAIHGTPIFLYLLAWIGAFTAVWATILAIRENDMKRLMAYSTVSNIGFIILALCVNTAFGVAAAIFHTFNHMIFKGGIFLSLASVKFRTGEREMHRLGGIAYRMPIAFFAFLLGIIAAAGIPPMSAFVSKWMVFQSLFSHKLLFLMIPAFFASTASFMYLYRGLHSIYLGQLSPRFARIKPAPPLQSIAMIILMIAMYAVGTFPGLTLVPLNNALTASGIGSIGVTLESVTGITTTVNLTVVSVVFLGSVIGVFVLYLLGKRRAHVEALDTYTSGETPEDWGMIPEQYHYAYRFYEPWEKMTNPLVDTVDFERWFGNIRHNFARASRSVARWMSARRPATVLAATALVVILFLGVLL